MDNNENLVYCSDLAYDIFRDTVNNNSSKPRLILGRYVFDPNLLLDCGEIVYCNHPELKNNSYYSITLNPDRELVRG